MPFIEVIRTQHQSMIKTVLLVISITILSSCKKNTVHTPEPIAISKCNGRYDKDLFPSVKATLNVQYGSNENIDGIQEKLYLDVYEPNNDVITKRPLVIFVHGGGWTSGTKTQGKELCTALAKKGYVAVSIDYRLGIEDPLSDKTRGEAVYRGVHDIKAALRYFAANSNLFKIDTEQIFLGGYSAGAVNAIHATYWDEVEVPSNVDKNRWGSLEGTSGNPNFPTNVNAVFSIAGSIVDLNWIQAGEPPVLCVHSKTDGVEPYLSGIDGKGILVYGGASIIPKALSLNISATLFTFDTIAHGDYLQPTYFPTTFKAVSEFLYTQVKCK